jgi:hypothetical protein
MAKGDSEVSGKSSEKPVSEFVSPVAEAADLLRRVAEPRPVGDSVKAAINRAAFRVSLPPGRVQDLWYSEARMVRSNEMDAIRSAAARRAREEAKNRDAAFASLRSLRDTYAATDPEFYREQILAIEQVLRDAGDRIHSVGEGDLTDPE